MVAAASRIEVAPASAPAARAKTWVITFWILTALFCLQMFFTAYAELFLPQASAELARLGFPQYFRVELSLAKWIGIAALLLPVPARVKEWAYAGFAINLVSAVLAHVAMGEGFAAWSWAAGTFLLGAGSYVCWRKLAG